MSDFLALFVWVCQMLGKNDASLLLLFDPSARPSSDEERDLPLKIFSTLHDVSSTEGSQVRLGQVSGWKIESGEAERVAVSSVSRDQFGGSTGSGESSRESFPFLLIT